MSEVVDRMRPTSSQESEGGSGLPLRVDTCTAKPISIPFILPSRVPGTGKYKHTEVASREFLFQRHVCGVVGGSRTFFRRLIPSFQQTNWIIDDRTQFVF